MSVASLNNYEAGTSERPPFLRDTKAATSASSSNLSDASPQSSVLAKESVDTMIIEEESTGAASNTDLSPRPTPLEGKILRLFENLVTI